MVAKHKGMICAPGESKTVSCRQIDNGYIVSESSYDAKGNYKSSERFTPDKPKLELSGRGGAKPKARSSNSLSQAVRHAGGRKK